MQTNQRFLPCATRRKGSGRAHRAVSRAYFLVVLVWIPGLAKNKYKARKRLLQGFGGQELDYTVDGQGRMRELWRVKPKPGMTETDFRLVLASRGITHNVYYDCDRSGRTFWNASGVGRDPKEAERFYQENKEFFRAELFRIGQRLRAEGKEEVRKATRRVRTYANTDRSDLHARAMDDLQHASVKSRTNDDISGLYDLDKCRYIRLIRLGQTIASAFQETDSPERERVLNGRFQRIKAEVQRLLERMSRESK